MAVTILGALQNANFNIQNNGGIGLVFAKNQLNNAVTLLEKSYDLYDEVEPLLRKYGNVTNVPPKGSGI